MGNERRTMSANEEHKRLVERGLRVELLETIPEGTGEKFLQELHVALQTGQTDLVLTVLKKIGDTLHARWGFTQPTKPQYEKDMERYTVGLSTDTSGTRLFLNTKERSLHRGDLIFPNVNLGYKMRGLTLAHVFEELFGTFAVNIQPDSGSPYYVVKF